MVTRAMSDRVRLLVEAGMPAKEAAVEVADDEVFAGRLDVSRYDQTLNALIAWAEALQG